jgi:hypothetical protein
VRSARVFNFMTPDEAAKLGITEDDRRRHVRIANGKANMGPLGKAEWIKIEVKTCPTATKLPAPVAGSRQTSPSSSAAGAWVGRFVPVSAAFGVWSDT